MSGYFINVFLSHKIDDKISVLFAIYHVGYSIQTIYFNIFGSSFFAEKNLK